MKFSEILDEYLDLREKGPDESSGYSDKAYYTRMNELSEAMDMLAPGEIIFE
jgi:hypothetical protein